MTSQTKLDRVDGSVGRQVILPVGWVLATIGFYGPWIAHPTAALTLSGVDMGEFVKFLPGVLDGSLEVKRLLFYLPAFSIVVSVALLVGAKELRLSRLLRVAMLLLATIVSLQLLPPAWSPASLLSSEFQLQTLGLGVCWLLLAGFWLWGRLPSGLAGLLSAALSLTSMLLSAWQFLVVKPAIDAVYRLPVAIGWGFFACMAGLAAVTTGSAMLALRMRIRSREL